MADDGLMQAAIAVTRSVPELRIQIEAAYGPAGASWFDALPQTITDAARNFGLTELGTIGRGTYSLVVEAAGADSTAAVLKLVYPTPDSASEIELLTRADGRGYVRVLAADARRGTCLLERLPSDNDFYRIGPDSDEAVTHAVARCVRDMWHGNAEDLAHFPSVRTWCADFDRVTATPGAPAPAGYTRAEIVAAQHEFTTLLEVATDVVVLHGDLHHGNLLLDRAGRPVAIDPKGVTGPLVYELGAFMRNPGPALAEWPDPTATLLRRAATFADELGVAASLVLRWSLVQLALSAVWAATDGDHAWSQYAATLKPFLLAAADAAS